MEGEDADLLGGLADGGEVGFQAQPVEEADPAAVLVEFVAEVAEGRAFPEEAVEGRAFAQGRREHVGALQEQELGQVDLGRRGVLAVGGRRRRGEAEEFFGHAQDGGGAGLFPEDLGLGCGAGQPGLFELGLERADERAGAYEHGHVAGGELRAASGLLEGQARAAEEFVDAGGDAPGLVAGVRGLEQLGAPGRARAGDEPGRRGQDGGGGVQDALAGAVVPRQPHDMEGGPAGPQALPHVAGRAAEAVDALVRVADGEEALARGAG